MKRILFFTLLLISSVSYSQFKVSGIITQISGELTETVPFANIMVKGTSIGAASDFDGAYQLPLKKGKYTLVISNIGLKTQELTIEIIDKDIVLNVALETNESTIGTFVYVEKSSGESKAADIEAIKKSNGLESVIGAQKLKEKGISDVAEGASKVVGLSVVGSGNVYVRGMGDRYNSAYLNGLPIASPDPDKKVIPLDIFPASVIKNLAVKKAFLPNFEGDFSGGVMDINTKDYPSEKIFKVSLGTGFNSQTIGRKRMTYQGGRFDYFGFDDGTRAIPTEITRQEAYKSTEGDQKIFGTNLNPIYKSVLPNSSFGLLTGNLFDLKNNESKIGYLISLNHSNSTKYEFGKYKVINTQEDVQIDYDFDEYTTKTSTSLLSNLAYETNDNNIITYNFLYVNLSEDETKEIYGSHWDYARNVYSRRYTFQQNSLMNNQLSGSHFLLKDNKLRLRWSTAINTAKSTEPDRRQLVYFYDDKDNTENYTFNATDRIENHRFFSFLNENQFVAKAETEYIFKYNTENVEDGSKISATLGGQVKRKKRDFDYKQYVYDLNINQSSVDVLSPDSYINKNSHDRGLFTIQEALNPASAYLAEQNINAAYGFFDINISKSIEIIGGARLELSDQKITYQDQTQPDFKRINRIVSTDILPSLILKYQPNDTNIVRMSASKTISRPGFKEVAPFQYTEVFAGATTVGNPELINGENYNFDLRYERYPKRGQFMAVGVFYKHLINPIEKTMEVATNQLQSFRNAEKATVAGIEFEFNKSLDFLGKTDYSFWNNISLGLNGTYLYSKVNFEEGANVAQTNSERALQGASPYLINIDLAYSKYLTETTKANFSLSYNVFGRRIYNVGIYGLGDVYELPVNSLNLVAGLEFEHFSYGLRIKNLLNQDVRFEQETSNSPVLINSTRRGIFTSLSVGYKF